MNNLTQSQMLLWMGQQLNPLSPLYNMAFSFDFKGALKPASFQAAFKELLQQCDSMRSVFVVDQSVPKQRVSTHFDYELIYLDWSDKQMSEAAIAEWITQRSQQLFDLEKRAFDSVLIKLSDQHHIWYLNQHHLITDAWAITVMYRAMSEYYQLAETGQLAAAKPLPSFQEYVNFEANHRQTDQASDYWLAKTAQLPATLPRLYGFSGLETTSKAQRIKIELGNERSQQLRELALASDLRSWTIHASLFNVFMTVFFAYLHRVGGQRELAIGTPAHNRTKPAFKNTAGVFIELFPISAALTEEDTFSSLFERIRTEINGFLRYAEAGTSTAELNRSFGAVLNYIHASFGDFADLQMQSEWIHPGHCDPRHHIRMQVYDFDKGGDIQVYFDLNEDVFDEDLRQAASGHFLQLLDGFIADRTQLISTPSLLGTTQQAAILAHITPKTNLNESEELIVDLFEQQVTLQQAQVALHFKGQQMSYATLNSKANQLAHHLLQNGIGQGHQVALHLSRSPELLIGIWGVLKAGATYVPIPPDFPASRVDQLLQEAQASMVLTSEALAQRFSATTDQLLLDRDWETVAQQPTTKPNVRIQPDDLAYIMFTSGSTGQPKGVMISHRSLVHYIQYAQQQYVSPEQMTFALFTRIGFDLTVTSLFTPLISGGQLVIYEEQAAGPDLAILEVMADNAVDVIKLTPSHLELLKDKNWQHSRIRCMIVGGENFKASLAQSITEAFPSGLKIYNEYGPTEATVGCIVHQYEAADRTKSSVPIGKPTPGMQAYILDKAGNLLPPHLIGELYLTGSGLAQGYWLQEELTADRFIDNPFVKDTKMYQSGDLARLNSNNEIEYLGRVDKQIKVAGIRVEPGEIEAKLLANPLIEAVAVDLWERPQNNPKDDLHYCNSCGLPSNYPNVVYDEAGVCNFCNAFETYEQKAQAYFKNLDDLRAVFDEAQSRSNGDYDCMMLLSGGKDSTYALGQLVEMGYRVLAFTLDNGYISQQALDNVRRVAADLGVDCIVGETEAMNEIFVDSLNRHCNVCNGCFKTIYTLATQIAVDKNIPLIVTGLSRGQFFETRLTEELFLNEKMDVAGIDQIILNARKEYHQVDDAVKRLMDTSIFDDESVFEKVQFVDYYRYTDVSLQEMYVYLDQRLPWVRPTDTGRSTNCLINKLGIHVHTKTQGHSNYAFPYSWDVRMGHKQRDTAIDEINEPIDLAEVQQMMREIGYTETQQRPQELVAFYVAPTVLSSTELRQQLADSLPEYMIPTRFYRLAELPLTANGKIDRQALSKLDIEIKQSNDHAAAESQLEVMIAELWEEILQLKNVSIRDSFLELGGTSLAAIRLISRINEMLEIELPLNLIFQHPTIESFAIALEETLEKLLEEMED